MYQYCFINCNKCTTSMQDVSNTGNSSGAGKREYMGILLSVYLNLKFLRKIKPIPKNKFSTLLIIKNMQIKTTMSTHNNSTPTRMTKIPKKKP